MHLPTFQFKNLCLVLSLALTIAVAILMARTCRIVFAVSCDGVLSMERPQLKCELRTGSRQLPSKLQDQNKIISLLRNGSSIYCFGENKRDRICKFRHLCYSSKFDKYIFFHGPETFQSGVPTNRYDPALLDLTSVDDHNTQYFNYVDLPASSVGIDFNEIELISHPSLLFHRFNPQNLMHVFHDDLLPLWMTVRLLFTQFIYSSVQLVMMDGRDQGPWFELYKVISTNTLRKADIQKQELTCFKDAVVGLSKETTWYQYGFKVPQGPISNFKASRYQLGLFAHEYVSHYKCREMSKHNVVLISRKQTRRLLNEVEVSIALANFFKKDVVFLNFESQSFNDAICMIQHADVLVGMHGAELVLALFMQPGSTVVELFPYGINPDHYTPYRTLAIIQGLQYIAWRNMDPHNTQSYPDRSPEQGGISHLSQAIKEEILASVEIPQHLCCNDPYWLHRIYQDTYVDTDSLELSLSNLTISNKETGTLQQLLLYPDIVQKASCLISTNEDSSVEFKIKWLPPLNAKYLGTDDLQYQVLFQRDEDINVSAYELSDTELVLKNIEFKRHCKLWIRCKVSNVVGPLSTTVNCLHL